MDAQCIDPDAHNTSLNAQWISCQERANPLNGLPSGHWIMYQFEQISSIEGLKIWNVNHPAQLDNGSAEIRIDVSRDGGMWETIDTVSLERGSGTTDYLGEDIEGFEGMEAQYVLLTMISNHGGDCTGLSEVRFTLGEVSTSNEEVLVGSLRTWPNPADQVIRIQLNELVGELDSYQISDMLGRVVHRQEVLRRGVTQILSISTSDLNNGHYVIQLRGSKGIFAQPIIVVHPN